MDDVFEQATETATEASPPEAPPEATAEEAATEEPKPTETDRIAALEKRNRDLESQLKNRDKTRSNQEAWDVRFQGLEKTINALLKRELSREDAADLTKEVQSIQQETATATTQRAWERSYARASDLMREALQDDDGNEVIKVSAPELAQVREKWAGAKEANDAEGLLEAVHMANRVRLSAERKAAQAKPAPEPEKPPGSGLEMANVSGGPAASMSDNELVKAFGQGKVGWTPEVQAAFKRQGLPTY